MKFCEHIKQTYYRKFTMTRMTQKRASWRNVLVGFNMNIAKMMTSASGFEKAGRANASEYKKLRTLKVQTTPIIAASSIKCCSDK